MKGKATTERKPATPKQETRQTSHAKSKGLAPKPVKDELQWQTVPSWITGKNIPNNLKQASMTSYGIREGEKYNPISIGSETSSSHEDGCNGEEDRPLTLSPTPSHDQLAPQREEAPRPSQIIREEGLPKDYDAHAPSVTAFVFQIPRLADSSRAHVSTQTSSDLNPSTAVHQSTQTSKGVDASTQTATQEVTPAEVNAHSETTFNQGGVVRRLTRDKQQLSTWRTLGFSVLACLSINTPPHTQMISNPSGHNQHSRKRAEAGIYSQLVKRARLESPPQLAAISDNTGTAMVKFQGSCYKNVRTAGGTPIHNDYISQGAGPKLHEELLSIAFEREIRSHNSFRAVEMGVAADSIEPEPLD
ncbi:hypothetical protein PGT21_033850 [Puccinia graminis f. sp. tritici]|uniref:Uncharacterized protein n=1 Tax=Puccinia graminis f. sp. tritici TaxID=56615 RepID=A0A5B0Q7N6_PUCGR|nr:hypothetical protein PGT21_033850 [Puccinia graminis f. sp. tritici]